MEAGFSFAKPERCWLMDPARPSSFKTEAEHQRVEGVVYGRLSLVLE